MDRSLTLATVVLAAGAGRRFSSEPGAKLLAELDGRPLLGHVLLEVRRFGHATTVVVLGHGAARIEATIDWADELRVHNPQPDRGLASSLKVGLDALMALPQPFDGAFIVLGDQPRLRADVMRQLASAAATARPADRPVVAPRYQSDDGPRNPVLLLRPAWSWADDIDGDQGLASLIAARPHLTMDVPVHGSMPDVDTTADREELESGSSMAGDQSSGT